MTKSARIALLIGLFLFGLGFIEWQRPGAIAFAYGLAKAGITGSAPPAYPVAKGSHPAARELSRAPQMLISVMDPHPKTAELSFESRFLRSALLARPYGLTSAQLNFEALPKTLSGSGGELFIAAISAMGYPNCCMNSSASSLKNMLESVNQPYALSDLPADVPRMNADDLMLLHVYAMVSAGQQQQAVELLSPALKSKSAFTQAFAVNALRAIGSPQARVILKELQSDQSLGHMALQASFAQAQNFFDPYRYEGELPRAERTRMRIYQQASDDAKQTGTILPSMLLAFLADDAEPAQLEAEFAYLRGLTARPQRMLSLRHDYGVAALAFRGGADFDFWLKAFAVPDGLARHNMVRAMALLDPERFMREAPGLLAAEKRQSLAVDELLFAYTEIAQGRQPFSQLDLIFAPSMQYRLWVPAKDNAWPKKDGRALLEVWAQGALTVSPDCLGCLPSFIGKLVTPELEALFLQGFLSSELNQKAIVTALYRHLTDPRLVPVMDWVLTQDWAAEQREQIQEALEYRNVKAAQKQCSEPSEACLRVQLRISPSSDQHTTKLASRAEVMALLKELQTSQAPTIRFTDELKREAEVTIGTSTERWSFWLGSWRRT